MNFSKFLKHWSFQTSVAVGLLLADRLTKYFWSGVKNTGWFYWQVDRWWLVAVAIVVLMASIFVWVREPRWRLALGLVVLGGLSNLYDRVAWGYVIDWIPLFSLSVFNLADVMIILGCGLVVLTTVPKSSLPSRRK